MRRFCQERTMIAQAQEPTRREFLAATAAVAAAPTVLNAAQPAARIPIGYDNFAVRAMGWKADQLLDYGAKHEIDSILISDLDALESFETAYLERIRAKAKDLGIGVHLGTWSICPTSTT